MQYQSDSFRHVENELTLKIRHMNVRNKDFSDMKDIMQITFTEFLFSSHSKSFWMQTRYSRTY